MKHIDETLARIDQQCFFGWINCRINNARIIVDDHMQLGRRKASAQ